MNLGEVCNLLKLSQLGCLDSYSTLVYQAESQLACGLELDKTFVPAPKGDMFLRLRNLGCSTVLIDYSTVSQNSLLSLFHSWIGQNPADTAFEYRIEKLVIVY